MSRLLEIKSFLFSHYFSDGLRITVGVLLPPLLLAQAGQLELGVTISLGALCVSIADSPGPVIHKRNGMLYCNLFVFFAALITGFISNYPVLIAAEIFCLCFFFSMFNVYGNRASSIGTAALVIMVLTIDQQRTTSQVLMQSVYVLGGGIWYMLLSLSLTQIRPFRLAQQELGECIHEVSVYLRLKAVFYDVKSDFDANYLKLVEQQVTVNQQQDVVRELLFKSRMMIKESTRAGRFLILVFVDIVDLFEQTMATHYDYQAIRNNYGKAKVLHDFKQIIIKLANELENLGFSIMSNTVPQKLHDFQPELENLKLAIDRVEQEYGINNLVLKKILINIRNIVDRIRKIYNYFDSKQLAKEQLRNQGDLIKFVSHQEFDLKSLRNNLSLNSTIFRHSLRVAIGCLIGYLVSKLFPFGHHSYWILLTILVILKPGFSLTKQRNIHRLIGTLAGGIVGGLIIFYIDNQTVLFVLLLIFMLGTYSFQRLNYVVSVLFMTPYILILFSFLGAGNINIAQERIFDTLVGSVIAFAASYFLLPSWEHVQLRSFMREILVANYNYLLHAANGLAGREIEITAYKLTRKDVYVSSANLASAFQRMLSEPKSKQRNAQSLHKFVVLNHMLSSYIVTLISRLRFSDNKTVYPDHIKLVRKSLYALNETIQQIYVEDAETFIPAEIIVPEGNILTDTSENQLFTEQLNYINKLTGDILKISKKLR